MRKVLFPCVILAVACAPSQMLVSTPESTATDALELSPEGYLDKVLVGYQGWFGTPADGSPVGEWIHWSAGVPPAPSRVTFELFPDIREYADEDLFETHLGKLGDGRSARLYSTHSSRVVDLHFRWMEENGIDGVGLQRFITSDRRHLEFRNDVTRYVRGAAEARGRVFFIEYDISGADATSWTDEVKHDWTDTMESLLGITASPRYLHVGGRPVVALWGLGFSDRPGTPAQSIALIDWFKARGCYVVGGVPFGWRTGSNMKPGFQPVWDHLDVLQPWAVGALATEADAETQRWSVIAPDMQYAAQHNFGYQRVIFPGFAWSNWNGGARNMIPRKAGRFFWAQALAARRAGSSVFIAMFDEFDEGTAIAKAAEDSAQAPTSQYFLTLDADGTRVSSDFYLRLAGAATRMLKAEAPETAVAPVPFLSPAPTESNDVPIQSPALDITVKSFTASQADVILQRLYLGVFDRAVDPSGAAAYGQLIQDGMLYRVVSALVTSAEFENHRPKLRAHEWAEALYGAILDRRSDPGGLEFTLTNILKANACSRIADMVLSPEYASKNL